MTLIFHRNNYYYYVIEEFPTTIFLIFFPLKYQHAPTSKGAPVYFQNVDTICRVGGIEVERNRWKKPNLQMKEFRFGETKINVENWAEFRRADPWGSRQYSGQGRTDNAVAFQQPAETGFQIYFSVGLRA